MFLIDETKFSKLPDNGKTRYGGNIFFAWKCTKCEATFKEMFKSMGEFDATTDRFQQWQKEHINVCD
jgi:hypothetical protein